MGTTLNLSVQWTTLSLSVQWTTLSLSGMQGRGYVPMGEKIIMLT